MQDTLPPQPRAVEGLNTDLRDNIYEQLQGADDATQLVILQRQSDRLKTHVEDAATIAGALWDFTTARHPEQENTDWCLSLQTISTSGGNARSRMKRKKDRSIGTITLCWGLEIVNHYTLQDVSEKAIEIARCVAMGYPSWPLAVQRLNAAMLHRHTLHVEGGNDYSPPRIGNRNARSSGNWPVEKSDLERVVEWTKGSKLHFRNDEYQNNPKEDIALEMQQKIRSWVDSDMHGDYGLSFDDYGLLMPRRVAKRKTGGASSAPNKRTSLRHTASLAPLAVSGHSNPAAATASNVLQSMEPVFETPYAPQDAASQESASAAPPTLALAADAVCALHDNTPRTPSRSTSVQTLGSSSMSMRPWVSGKSIAGRPDVEQAPSTPTSAPHPIFRPDEDMVETVCEIPSPAPNVSWRPRFSGKMPTRRPISAPVPNSPEVSREASLASDMQSQTASPVAPEYGLKPSSASVQDSYVSTEDTSPSDSLFVPEIGPAREESQHDAGSALPFDSLLVQGDTAISANYSTTKGDQSSSMPANDFCVAIEGRLETPIAQPESVPTGFDIYPEAFPEVPDVAHIADEGAVDTIPTQDDPTAADPSMADESFVEERAYSAHESIFPLLDTTASDGHMVVDGVSDLPLVPWDGQEPDRRLHTEGTPAPDSALDPFFAQSVPPFTPNSDGGGASFELLFASALEHQLFTEHCPGCEGRPCATESSVDDVAGFPSEHLHTLCLTARRSVDDFISMHSAKLKEWTKPLRLARTYYEGVVGHPMGSQYCPRDDADCWLYPFERIMSFTDHGSAMTKPILVTGPFPENCNVGVPNKAQTRDFAGFQIRVLGDTWIRSLDSTQLCMFVPEPLQSGADCRSFSPCGRSRAVFLEPGDIFVMPQRIPYAAITLGAGMIQAGETSSYVETVSLGNGAGSESATAAQIRAVLHAAIAGPTPALQSCGNGFSEEATMLPLAV